MYSCNQETVCLIKKIMEEIPERLLANLLKTYNEVELKKDALIITEQIND